MPVATGVTQLKNVTLDVLLLPRGSRTVTPVTITAGTAADEADETISLTATTSTDLAAGTSLSFNPTGTGDKRRRQVLILEDATVSSTASEIDCAPLVQAVPANATASYIEGLLPVFGLTDYGFNAQDTTVDSTNAQSGAGTETEIVRSGLEFSISLIEQIADKGLTEIIKKVGLEFAFKGREIYAVLTYPDGETHAGAAKVMNYQQPGNPNEIKKATFTLQFQGSSYRYTPAYSFAATP